MNNLKSKTTLSLRDAAELLVTGLVSAHDAEVILAHAIEHGELQANVKRWATEQWEGGNCQATSIAWKPSLNGLTWTHGRELRIVQSVQHEGYDVAPWKLRPR